MFQEQTIETVMQADHEALSILPLDTSVEDAQGHAGKVIVVTGPQSYPAGILLPETLAGIRKKTAKLDDYYPHVFMVPIVATPQTSLGTLLQHISLTPQRWFVVREDSSSEVQGVVSPGRFLEVLRDEVKRQKLWVPGMEFPALRSSLVDVPGVPAPQGCFHCGAASGHTIRGGREHYDAAYNAICPSHGTVLIPLAPCP